MLPYTPLHHLMLQGIDRPIVLTSGNLSDEPQCIDNDAAREKLGSLATHFLLHNRDIVNRVDDSVVRVVNGQRQTLRRARGYAPAPIRLPEGFEDVHPILAMGGELKSTFCLSRSGEAILSQHLGDLENAAAFEAYQDALDLYTQLFEHEPVALAADLHPDYLSTKLAQELAQTQNLPLYGIQHHHAHIAACMVEHGLPIAAAPVLGIALDGLGYGDDGQLWGGEFLVANYQGFRRVACFEPMAMLGGSQATRQPWRNTYAWLVNSLGWDTLTNKFGDLELVQFLAAQPRPILDQMLATGLRSPLASSAGRLFDAIAAAVGCCRNAASYEGQGAIELEALMSSDMACDHPYPLAVKAEGQLQVLSAAPLWPQLLQDLRQGVDQSLLAARFHYGLADAISHLAIKLTHQHRLSQVMLSGGVFQNKVLLTSVQAQLHQAGLTVLTPHEVPPNDGGISLGQIAIAAARLKSLPKHASDASHGDISHPYKQNPLI
jgi:hydrogenase maturation protein HypF